jgi:hypothetical protein
MYNYNYMFYKLLAQLRMQILRQSWVMCVEVKTFGAVSADNLNILILRKIFLIDLCMRPAVSCQKDRIRQVSSNFIHCLFGEFCSGVN